MVLGSSQNCQQGWRAWDQDVENLQGQDHRLGQAPGRVWRGTLGTTSLASLSLGALESRGSLLAEVSPLSGEPAPQEKQVAGILGIIVVQLPLTLRLPIGGFPSTGRIQK